MKNALLSFMTALILGACAFTPQYVQASDGGAQHIQFGPFFTSNGTLYQSPFIYHYAAGTTTNKNCWSDEGKTATVAQPFVGDTTGIARIFCDGDYKFVITDSSQNNLYTWDNVKVTSDTATMWEGNAGTAYPSASSTNRWQMFLKHDGSNNILELGVNDGTTFKKIAGSNPAIKTETNVFTVPQEFASGNATSPSITFSGGDDGIYAKSQTQLGFSINSTEVMDIDSTGDVTANSFTVSASKTCATGFSRISIFCFNADGHLVEETHNQVGSAVGDTTINWTSLATAKAALVRISCRISQDGTGETSQLFVYVRPATSGDQSVQVHEKVCEPKADLANEISTDFNEFWIVLDGSGDFEFESAVTGSPLSTNISFKLAGYID